MDTPQTATRFRSFVVAALFVVAGIALGVVGCIAVVLYGGAGWGEPTATTIGTSPDGRYALLAVQSGFQDKAFWTELHTTPVVYDHGSAPGASSRCATGDMAEGEVTVVRPEIVVRYRPGDVAVVWAPLTGDEP